MMALSRYRVLAVLVLVASDLSSALPHEPRDDNWHSRPHKHTTTGKPSKSTSLPLLPPTPSNQISLGPPPGYSISWDVTAPAPTDGPGDDTPPVNPGPSNQISLNPPSYSISWDTGSQPTPTSSDDSGDYTPPTPPFGPPTPSNEISLYPPSYSVSWDTGAQPTSDDSGVPPVIAPTLTNDIPLPLPTYSMSWYKRQDDDDTTEPPAPAQPTPPDQISIQPPVPSISWGKRDAEPQTNSWGIQFPSYSFYWPKPPKHTSAYVSWGKRQYIPDPTETPTPQDPGDPQDPENPDPEPTPGDDEPVPAFPTPSDEIGLQPPTATVIWGKRQFEYDPDPTETSTPQDPEDPQDPENSDPEPTPGDDEPEPALPTPSDEIGLEPPTATVIWGKRNAEPEPQTDSWGVIWPSDVPSPSWAFPQPPPQSTSTDGGYLTWGKRDPQWVSWDVPFPPHHRTHTTTSTSTEGGGWISWGRDAAPEPTAAPNLEHRDEEPKSCSITTTVTRPVPCPMVTCDIICPLDSGLAQRDTEGSISSEPAEHKSVDCPVTITVPSKCPTCDCPTLRPTPIPLLSTKVITSKATRPHSSGLCPTKTVTIVPPCVPPFCPKHTETPCNPSLPVPTWETRKRMVEVREVEKRVITIKSVQPGGPMDGATSVVDPACTDTPVVTVDVGCPTYTCLPHCDPVQIVR